MFNNTVMLRSQQRFKSDYHEVYTEEVYKIHQAAMMIRDCQHLMELQHIHTEKNAFKVCKSKMVLVKDFFWKITKLQQQ